MLYFGFDRAEVSPDRLYVQANGLPRRGGGVIITSLARSTFTPSMIVTNPLNCRAEPLDSLIRSGKPFVYPIDVVGWQPLYCNPGVQNGAFGSIPADILDIPEDVFAACRKGKAIILFCYAYEGDCLKFKNEFGVFWAYDFIHGFCLKKDIPFESVWVFNGNQSSMEEFNEWLACRGLKAPQTFQFRVVDSFHTLYQQAYHYRRAGKDYAWDRDPHNKFKCVASLVTSGAMTGSFDERYVNPDSIRRELESAQLREKLFLSMAGAARASRRVVAASLAAMDLLDRGFVSFPKVNGSIEDAPRGSNLCVRTVFGKEIMPDFIKEGWEKLLHRLPLTIDVGDPSEFQAGSGAERSGIYDLGDLTPFVQSYINIINESHFCASNQITITEKTTKVIACLQPFVAVASHLFLGYLRRQGFKTFSRIIDEEYDGICDNYERIIGILKVLDWMKGLSQQDACDLYANLLPETEHNFNHFVSFCFPYERGLMEIAALLGCEWRTPPYRASQPAGVLCGAG